MRWAPLLVPGALVLSMQNGVDNVEQIRVQQRSKLSRLLFTSQLSVPHRPRETCRPRVIWWSAGKPEDEANRGTFFARVVCLAVFLNIEGELWPNWCGIAR